MKIPTCAVSEVTLWYRKNGEAYEFNHMSNGHCEVGARFPTATDGNTQRGWSSGEWVYEYAWLDGSKSPKILRDETEILRSLLSRR